jgi:hypothetical protein
MPEPFEPSAAQLLPFHLATYNEASAQPAELMAGGAGGVGSGLGRTRVTRLGAR